jgi:hypothetical protein
MRFEPTAENLSAVSPISAFERRGKTAGSS